MRNVHGDSVDKSGALHRGLSILETLLANSTPLSSREIANSVGLHDTTVARLLQVLLTDGYICRDRSKRYFASPRTLAPLTLYHPLNLLRREASELLRELRDKYQLTSSLIVFFGEERLVLDVSAANDMLSPLYETYLQTPLHASATGKLLLASLSPARRKELLGSGPYQVLTPHTIFDPKALEVELSCVKQRGYASTIEENHLSIAAIGAAINDATGRLVGCLMLAGPAEKLKEHGVTSMGDTLASYASLLKRGSPALKIVSNMTDRID